MIIIDKVVDKVWILYNPKREQALIGENLLLYEPELKINPNGVVAQILEEKPYLAAGMRDSLLLESVVPEVAESSEPKGLEATRSELKNQKVLVAKIRLSAHVSNGSPERFQPWNGWSPTPGCKVAKINDEEILRYIDLEGTNKEQVARIGKTRSGADFNINLFYMHGVSAILGGRGTGKSHLAKSMALRLIDCEKKIIVFDINDEWSAMQFNADGSKSKYYEKILKVDPGINVSFDLGYLGKQTFLAVLKAMKVDEMSATMQTVSNLWNELSERDLSLQRLKDRINKSQEKVKEALLTRLNQLESSGIISIKERGDTIEGLLNDERLARGGLLVVNLKDKTRITQFIIVQLFISKLANILSKSKADSLILLLEEAQTYMEHSDLEEVVTRLRHLGLHQIYITNNPQSIQAFLLSHITNWFVFNLTNDQDIEYLQNSLPLDLDSARTFIKMLPPKNTLVLINETYQGKNKNYPFIVEVEALPYQTAGITRELFKSP